MRFGAPTKQSRISLLHTLTGGTNILPHAACKVNLDTQEA